MLEARGRLTQLPGRWSGLSRIHEAKLEAELPEISSAQAIEGQADERLDGNIIVYPLPKDTSDKETQATEKKVDLLKSQGHLSTTRAIGVIAVEEPTMGNEDCSYVLSEADALVRELRKHGIAAGIIETGLLGERPTVKRDGNLHEVAGLHQAVDATEASIGSDTEEHAVIVVADADLAVNNFAIPSKVAEAGQLAVLDGLGFNGHLNAQSWEGIKENHQSVNR